MTWDIAHLIVYGQAAGSVILLVGFLIATTLLQQRAMSQSTALLASASPAVQATHLYQSAYDYFARRQVPNLFTSPAHIVAIWFLIFIVFCCSLATYFGASFFGEDATPSYVLGGAMAVTSPTGTLAQFQSATVFTGSMAFLSAYIWTIGQLVNRMNNNDMSPLTYHFLSVRILTACLVAGIARHIVEAIPGVREVVYNADHAPVGLALLGFVIGWKPTFWIDELYRWARDRLPARALDQRQPKPENMPQNMTLAMIQGMIDGKIERLQELDIDNCQKLSRENAITIWLRTPYKLELVVDWIAQAQLCVLFEDDKIEALRKAGVRDIFGYLDAITQVDARNAIHGVLGTVPVEIIDRHQAYIVGCPAFARLGELRKAIHPG
jgi:hypothetical protein